MGYRKTPLKATINQVTLHLASQDPAPGSFAGVPGYRGERLYYHVDSTNNILTITVDQTSPDTNSAVAGASRAQVIIKYDTRAPITVDFPKVTYAPGTKIAMKLNVASDLSTATLAFTDIPRGESSDGTSLDFVLVQEGTLQEPRYRIEWIHNRIWIEAAALRTDSSVIEPLPGNGGAMGPMGLSTP